MIKIQGYNHVVELSAVETLMLSYLLLSQRGTTNMSIAQKEMIAKIQYVLDLEIEEQGL